jgi:hypothetical protein
MRADDGGLTSAGIGSDCRQVGIRRAGAGSVQARLRGPGKSAKFRAMSSVLIAPARLAALLSGGLLLLLRLARR